MASCTWRSELATCQKMQPNEILLCEWKWLICMYPHLYPKINVDLRYLNANFKCVGVLPYTSANVYLPNIRWITLGQGQTFSALLIFSCSYLNIINKIKWSSVQMNGKLFNTLETNSKYSKHWNKKDGYPREIINVELLILLVIKSHFGRCNLSLLVLLSFGICCSA